MMKRTMTQPTPEMLKAIRLLEQIRDELEEVRMEIIDVGKNCRLSDNTQALIGESLVKMSEVLTDFMTGRSRFIGAIQTHACEGFKKGEKFND